MSFIGLPGWFIALHAEAKMDSQRGEKQDLVIIGWKVLMMFRTPQNSHSDALRIGVKRSRSVYSSRWADSDTLGKHFYENILLNVKVA